VTTSPASASVGRPRNPAKDVAVLQATRELLIEVGYQATSVLAIARRAGVGAPTIYRRWPTKESLIEDAAFGHPQPAPVPEATGDLLTDLRAWVAMFLGWLADPAIRAALPGLLTAYHRDEQIYERLVLRSEADVRSLMGDMLSRALPDLPPGEITARADTVFDFLVATTVVRAMTRGLLDRDAFCERTARALRGLALATE
jgi:AcrR family transcriptional regulator